VPWNVELHRIAARVSKQTRKEWRLMLPVHELTSLEKVGGPAFMEYGSISKYSRNGPHVNGEAMIGHRTEAGVVESRH